MRIYYILFPMIVVIYAIIISSSLVGYASAQLNQTSSTYENGGAGIKFSYPSSWGKVGETEQGACSKPSCVLTRVSFGNSTDQFGFALGKFPKESCVFTSVPCNSLMDFVKGEYAATKSSNPGFTFINDNKTMIDKKYSAWQLEYSFLNNGVHANGFLVLTKINETYYSIGISYPDESRVKLLPEFKKLIDSVQFLPQAKSKIPSFMTNGTEQVIPENLQDNLNTLQILSHNSFTDSIGGYHVVGEVQNNAPTNARFLKVTGTFYDSNNQVVGTEFTFTSPSDIGPGEKAPFDLILNSASIPTSQIDHYNLIASQQ
jgi:hypothetical protein